MKRSAHLGLLSLGLAACDGDPGPTGTARLAIEMGEAWAALEVGQSRPVVFRARNTGTGVATSVVLEAAGTAALEVVTAMGCDVLGAQVSCEIGTLDVGASAERTVEFRAKAAGEQAITFSVRSTETGKVVGGTPNNNNNNNTNNGPSIPPADLTFSFTTVDDANAGWQPDVKARPGGGVGVAYYRRLADAGECTRLMNAPVGRWELVYAESTGGAFSTTVVAQVDLINLNGVSLAFDDAGEPAIAFMGGAEGAYRCGGTDLMLARRSGGRFTTTMVDGDGMATPVFPADVEACAFYQNTCNAGGQDVVGPWPALVFAGGQPFTAYRDIHFGFAQDDEEKADLEMTFGGQDGTLDATYGGGVFTRAALKNGQPAVIHLNRFGGENGLGIWLVEYDGSTWQKKKIASETDIGYTLAFAGRGSLLGAAYHARGKKKLYYLEAPSGTEWSRPEIVDQDGDTGLSPALAFDPAGAPALSYHLCGPYDPNQSECLPEMDALRYAIKIGGRWEKASVRTERAVMDGLNTSLAFDGSEPVIAFQAESYDPSTKTVVRELVVARGKKK